MLKWATVTPQIFLKNGKKGDVAAYFKILETLKVAMKKLEPTKLYIFLGNFLNFRQLKVLFKVTFKWV